MQEEIWLPTNLSEKYEVSNIGNIRNSKTKKLIKPYNNKGYNFVRLSIGNKTPTNSAVHRIVMNVFKPTENTKLQVNHIDCDKLNNNLDNLEWCTPKQNAEHAVKNKRRWAYPLSEEDKDIIIHSYYNLNKSLRKLSLQYNIHPHRVRRIVRKSENLYQLELKYENSVNA
jgi:hypothetical protein